MNQFAVAPSVGVQRSAFDRSHGNKLTLDADYLVPIFVDEVLPGDTFNLKAQLFGRLFSRIKTPLMDNLYLDTFYFFVPNRLVWDHWQQFMGEKKTPSDPDPSTFSIPQLFLDNFPFDTHSLPDYMGLPLGYGANNTPGMAPISALPFRCYNLIYDEWFRDQNLQAAATVVRGDSADEQAAGNWGLLYPLRKRGKRHDYFTSSLLTPQKGLASSISLGVSAPLQAIGAVPASYSHSHNFNASSFVNTPNSPIMIGAATANEPIKEVGSGVSAPMNLQDVGPTWAQIAAALQVDLSAAVPVTINAFRQAVAVQQLLELDNRGGTRYTEILRAHFQVVSPDARLQRPEFLGGGTSMININPIAATDSANLGNTASFGTFSHNDGFVHSFVEHGYIIGLASIRADLTYQQGIARHFQRQTRYDFYWPTFAHLGEQAVLTSEIFADDTQDNSAVFGYQERSGEYRYKPSQICGKFRSDAPGSLDSYHLAQDFGSAPVLDDSFIKNNTPMSRVLAVTTEPAFLLDCWFNLNTVRPMPVHAIPGLTRL